MSEIELAEASELPEQRWLDQLIDPGPHLAVPDLKLIIDTDVEAVCFAKFPSKKKDLENTELIEHFSHRLAAKLASMWQEQHAVKISDRTCCFLNASTENGCSDTFICFCHVVGECDDGAGSSTGNGYVDIVDFILKGCADVQQNRNSSQVAFNVMFGNTDDHFRDLQLPAFPERMDTITCIRYQSGRTHQCLYRLIHGRVRHQHLAHTSESYMLERRMLLREIIAEVRLW